MALQHLIPATVLLREIPNRGCPAGDHAAETGSKPLRPSKKDQQVKDDDGFPSSSLRYLHGRSVETVATQIAAVVTVTNPTKPANDFASDNISPLSDCPRHCVYCHGMPWAEPWLSTAQVAQMFGVQPATLRIALCKQGHYQGITPQKRANRLLSWPAAEVRAVLEAGQRR